MPVFAWKSMAADDATATLRGIAEALRKAGVFHEREREENQLHVDALANTAVVVAELRAIQRELENRITILETQRDERERVRIDLQRNSGRWVGRVWSMLLVVAGALLAVVETWVRHILERLWQAKP